MVGGVQFHGPQSRADHIVRKHRNNVPAINADAGSVRAGGLICYAADIVDEFRRAAAYVDHFSGAKPPELPVQTPTKFVMSVNLRTAKSLGLTVPPTILLSADEVIE